MRLQLALNVRNLEESVDFYSKFFNARPHKIRAGYANFAIDAPPLKLVLFENADASPPRTRSYAAMPYRIKPGRKNPRD